MIELSQNQTNKTFNRTIWPEVLDTEFTTSLDTLKNYTDFLEIFGTYVTELSTALNYRATIQAPDQVLALSDYYSSLDNFYFDKFNNEFVYYWVKKYNNTIKTIKDETSSKLETENRLQSYYDDVSDSIGILVNSKVKLDDSVIPYFDTHLFQYSQPVTWPVSINNKLSDNAKEISEELSRRTTTLLRTNLVNVQYCKRGVMIDKLDPTVAHSVNLITDLNYFNENVNSMSSFVKLLQKEFYRTFNYVSYFSNINDSVAYNPRSFKEDEIYSNLQEMYRYLIEVEVEGLKQQLDLLQKKSQTVITPLTLQRSLASIRSTRSYSASANDTTSASIDTQYFATAEDFNKNRFFTTTQNLNINSFTNFTPRVNEFLGDINQRFTDPIQKLDQQITQILSQNSAFQYVSEISSLGVPLGLPSLDFSTFLPGNFIPNLDNTGITGSISQITQSLGNFGIPNIIPNVNFGSLQTLAELGPSIVMNPAMIANPAGALQLAQSLKDTVCNFVPPTVDTSGLYDFTLTNPFADLESKLQALVNNIVSFFDFSKLAEKIKFNFSNVFKNFFDKLFKC